MGKISEQPPYYKLNQDTTTHLSERSKYKTLATPNAGGDAEPQKFSLTADGNSEVPRPPETGSFLQTKHTA